MDDPLKFWEMALQSATRALKIEGVDNISFARLKQIGAKDFEIEYGFFSYPTDEDLEALSLIETEIVSDIWRWVGDFHYTWCISSQPPGHMGDKSSMVFYRCPHGGLR